MSERAALLVAVQTNVLEAGEGAELGALVEAIDETEVGLGFLTVLEVEVLALALESVLVAKGGEVAAAALEGDVAVLVGAEVGA